MSGFLKYEKRVFPNFRRGVPIFLRQITGAIADFFFLLVGVLFFVSTSFGAFFWLAINVPEWLWGEAPKGAPLPSYLVCFSDVSLAFWTAIFLMVGARRLYWKIARIGGARIDDELPPPSVA